jgi:SET domain-containing protein
MPPKPFRQDSHKKWPVPMEVKSSAIEGRGLFTKVTLRQRQKIGEYEGELIAQQEGRKRAKTQKWIAIVEVNNGKSIDAAKETTGFRFINHSCTQNSFMRFIGERAKFYALQSISDARLWRLPSQPETPLYLSPPELPGCY